eukprot:GEMP01011182.1.p1 GENE.GEMP01011182.1~~GEMP01011182.1.p1  ORF type:complete len:901 (+),score=248.27 GEMP01011182.1:44-2704(+)
MEWICRTCTLRNPETTVKCVACDNTRNPRDACEPVVLAPTGSSSHNDVSTRAPRNSTGNPVLHLTVSDEGATSDAATKRAEHGDVQDAKALTVDQQSGVRGVNSAPEATAPAAMVNPNRVGMNATRVGIDREEQCRVTEEIRAKRRRQNEEKERILREFEADQAYRTRPSAPVENRPVPPSPPPRTSPSEVPSTVRIQLKAGSRSLVCSAFGPEATLREVLTFANEEMETSARIMRSEFLPNADPEFMRRTQEMLQQATAAQQATAGQRSTFVAIRLPYPPRTRWADADLDITLANAGLTPSCTVHLEWEENEGEAQGRQASASPGEEFRRRPRYSEVDSDEESIESWEVEGRSEEPRIPPLVPKEPLPAADRAIILEAAERRNAQAASSSSAPQQRPISCIPVSGPGSKTKKEQQEEKQRILQRADEERQEREMFQAASRAAHQEAQNAPAAPKQNEMTVQIRHAGGTEVVKVPEDMTFETLLADLRQKLHLGEEAFTFRTHYPARQFGADEQSLRIAATVSLPAVIFLEKQVPAALNSTASPGPTVEPPAVLENPDVESAPTADSPPRKESSGAREAALAAAESRRLYQAAPPEATGSTSTPISAPAPAPTSVAPAAPKDVVSASSGPGLSGEARLQRLQRLELDRKAKKQDTQRILKEAKADQAFRAAKRMVPVSGLSEHSNAHHAPSAPSEPMQSPSQSGRRVPFLRVRDPSGAMHLVNSTAEMSLADALTSLNIAPDAEALIALVPFPRRQLPAEDWLTPLNTHSDLFPHGTIIIGDASLQGQQQHGGAVVWNPFGVDAMHDALPPPMRDGVELRGRLARVLDGAVTEHLVREESCCGICLCDFQLHERLATLQCAHHFHWDCMERSLRYSAACPCCRQDV